MRILEGEYKPDADELFEQFCDIRIQLKTKLGKEFMKIIEIILTNFEELYENEWRLQNQLKEKEQITQQKLIWIRFMDLK